MYTVKLCHTQYLTLEPVEHFKALDGNCKQLIFSSRADDELEDEIVPAEEVLLKNSSIFGGDDVKHKESDNADSDGDHTTIMPLTDQLQLSRCLPPTMGPTGPPRWSRRGN